MALTTLSAILKNKFKKPLAPEIIESPIHDRLVLHSAQRDRDRPACSYMYFSTKDEKGREEKRGINTVIISNTRKEEWRKG
jgi:hypothetical protein